MEEKVRPFVLARLRRPRMREGRGFSLGEIRRAGLTVHEARRLGIPLDRRRKTAHTGNVQTLRQCYGVVIPLTEIRGVGEATERRLLEAEILDAYDLAHADLDSLAERIPLSRKSLEKWQEEARKLIKK